MPPHCDSLDGPVVTAAREALAAGDVELVLPFVHAGAEDELRDAFDLVVKARAMGGEAAAVADLRKMERRGRTRIEGGIGDGRPEMDTVREFALALPAAAEDFPWGETVIKVRRKPGPRRGGRTTRACTARCSSGWASAPALSPRCASS